MSIKIIFLVHKRLSYGMLYVRELPVLLLKDQLQVKTWVIWEEIKFESVYENISPNRKL